MATKLSVVKTTALDVLRDFTALQINVTSARIDLQQAFERGDSAVVLRTLTADLLMAVDALHVLGASLAEHTR